MKIYKFSVGLIFITLLALLYVHQQVQLIEVSYKIESNEKGVTTLLDQNKSLVYNITKLKSPVYLEKKFLASKKEFVIPQQWQVIEVAAPRLEKAPIMTAQARGRAPFDFFKLLGKPKEVFANTIK